MASTRNINTPGNYCLEQRQYQDSQQYTLYPNSQYGAAYTTNLPGNGLNPGQVPGNQLSNNAPDIESFLFGIGLTNLVEPIQPLVPQFKTLETENIYIKKPTLMPVPLVIEKSRPFPCP